MIIHPKYVKMGSVHSPNNKVSSLFPRAITLQHSVVKIKSELDSLRKGFELFGLIKMMEQHPLLLKSLFVAGSTDYEIYTVL